MATRVKRRKRHVPTPRELQVNKEIQQVFNEAAKKMSLYKADKSRIMYLRPSQLPFCSAAFFYNHAMFGPNKALNFAGSFYTSIGTSVHTVLQTFLGLSGRYLANWKCHCCKKEYKVTTKNECCDLAMEYHEIGIDYKGVKGHIDAVFLDSKGDYWIKDFKTTSVASAPNKKRDPGVVYREQVEAYALLLWLQFKIRVKGYIVAFIKRDRPDELILHTRELTNADFKAIAVRLKEQKKQHKHVLQISTKKEVLDLLKLDKCKNPYCAICKLTDQTRKQYLMHAYDRGKKLGYVPLVDMKVNKGVTA